MSIYSDLETSITGAMSTALGAAVPVYRLVDPGQIKFQQHPAAVSLILGEEARDPSEELGAVLQQDERWLWLVYVVAGTQQPVSEGRTVAYDVLAKVHGALCPSTGFKPDSYCGMVEHVSTEFVGFLPSGVLYLARYRHSRWTG